LISTNIIPPFSQYRILITKKPFLSWLFRKFSGQNLSNTLEIAVIRTEEQPIFPHTLHREVAHVGLIVTSASIHIDIRVVGEALTHVFPIASSADMRKLKHGFWIANSCVYKVFGP